MGNYQADQHTIFGLPDREREKEAERIFGKVMTKKIPKLTKT